MALLVYCDLIVFRWSVLNRLYLYFFYAFYAHVSMSVNGAWGIRGLRLSMVIRKQGLNRLGEGIY